MIDIPYTDLHSWVYFYTHAEIPVLKRTAAHIAELREQEDTVNGRSLGMVVLSDPLMALKVLSHLEANRRARQTTDITTIDRAIMMMGITPFFHTFENLPTLESHLAKYPRALIGLLKVITRAKHAAEYAREWALLRHDLEVEDITVAALLYHAAEILAWCFAPEMSLKVQELRRQNPHMRTTDAQHQVFGISANEVQIALGEAWHLPHLLQDLWHGRNSDHPRVRNVALAIDLARHAANGWDDPALPDDFQAIQELLHINRETLLHRLHLTPENLPPIPDPSNLSTGAQGD
ncbi:MAG: HDOD domain-containing protein [Rhodocyclaceae bacterium]|nr:HDOD domain-containing protein [Rhodocyclaceae bacterium]